MDLSLSSDEDLDNTVTSNTSNGSIASITSNGAPPGSQNTPPQPLTLNLRSKCAQGLCPLGIGLLFRSRISPSPGKG